MTDNSDQLLIAIAQLNPTIGDLVGNAEQILAAARQAVTQKARLMITPELSLCGYPPRDLLMQPGFITAMSRQLAALAQALPPDLAVLVGTVQENSQANHIGGKGLFNTIALLEGGKVQRYFAKRLLPTYDVFDEERYFQRGEAINHFKLNLDLGYGDRADQAHSTSERTAWVHIGVTVCEDLWNDEEFWGKRNYPTNPIADLADLGVELTVNLSASPYTLGKQHVREAMLAHCARRYQQPIVYVNQVGGNDDLIFDGGSVAVDRQGKLVSRSPVFSPDLAMLVYDLNQRDLSATPTHTITPLPDSEEAEIWSALVLGVQDYARKCGFKQAVIGLSGGIDSSLVAAIATAALGQANVFGILMPSPYSSDHSIQDALALADGLGIATTTLPIAPVMQGYEHTLANLFSGTEPGVAEENIQSRIRGNLLMAIANKFGYLLLSTGNKSEMAVGYCTLYGDMSGGLAVIADVPKTRVYALCEWLNAGGWVSWLQRQHHSEDARMSQAQISESTMDASPVIPLNVLTKPPSAELKPGQVDQDSLPPYPVLDDILDQLIHNYADRDQLINRGHEPKVVDQVLRLVSRAEFKRRQAPPGLKITDRAFGTGWRMPIACRWP